MKRKREKLVTQYVDDGEGNWLLSFADLMTLLLGFFIIMMAFSTPDPEKIEAFRRETSEGMGGEYVPVNKDVGGQIRDLLESHSPPLEDKVEVVDTIDGLAIKIKGTLFFRSGSADLNPDADALMHKLAKILAPESRGYRIVVEGHTDDIPIHSNRYPSNWELSSSRAGTVVRLLEQYNISRESLRPVGLADTEPIFPNRDKMGISIPENQAANRRIIIRLKKVIRALNTAKTKNAKALKK